MQRYLSQNGIASAGVVVTFLVVLGVTIPTLLVLKCQLSSCEPFSDVSLDEKVQLAEESARSASIASQFFYGTSVGDLPLLVGMKKYAYCRLGPGEVGKLRCTDTPTEGELRTVVRSFRPYPQSFMTALPFFQGFAHQLTVTRNGNTIFQAGNGDVSGGTASTFIVTQPIAGANNIEMKLVMNKESMNMGVTE